MAASDDCGTHPILLDKANVTAVPAYDYNGGESKHNAIGYTQAQRENDEVLYLNGEPVITTGRDVSRFLVDIRDTEEAQSRRRGRLDRT